MKYKVVLKDGTTVKISEVKNTFNSDGMVEFLGDNVVLASFNLDELKYFVKAEEETKSC